MTLIWGIGFSRHLYWDYVFKLALVLVAVKMTEDSSQGPIANVLHIGHKGRDEGGVGRVFLS